MMEDNIPLIRIKALKEDKFPENLIIFHFNGNDVLWNYATYNKDGLIVYETRISNYNCLLHMVKRKIFEGKVWIIGSLVYPMLCWQGLEEQIDSKTVEIPKRTDKEGKEVLAEA